MKLEQAELDRLLRAADLVEIQMLMAKYDSYLDRDDFNSIYTLMAQGHPELEYEIVEGGAYVGEHVTQLIAAQMKKHGISKNKRGWVGLQYLWTPRIILSKDGTRAHAQWNQLSPHGMPVTPYPGNEHRPTPYWFIGKYDNEFIKIDGEWKILKVHVCAQARPPYEEGWLRQPDCRRMYHPGSGKPDRRPRLYVYHPDAVYAGDSSDSYEPYMPEEGSF